MPEGTSPYNGNYFHRITYQNADLASIRALISKSTSCRQYISFNCYKSKILNAPVGPPNAQWLSSTGVLKNYWGGAPSNKDMCACGVTGTCDNPMNLCNCDIGDDKWRQDEGKQQRWSCFVPGGVTPKLFVRECSAQTLDPLPFYIPNFGKNVPQKATPFIYISFEEGHT